MYGTHAGITPFRKKQIIYFALHISLLPACYAANDRVNTKIRHNEIYCRRLSGFDVGSLTWRLVLSQCEVFALVIARSRK